MRRFDKNVNIEKANLLVERRYLEAKGLINEGHFADPMSKGTKIKFNGRDAEVIAFEANPYQEVSYTIKYDDNDEQDHIVGGDKNIKLNDGVLDEYDYRRFDQNYGTLEKDRKEKINQFGKDRQATYGIKMKGLNTDLTAFLSPRLSSDIYCRGMLETHRIPNLNDALSFGNKLYTQQHNNGNKAFYTGKDDETYKFFMHQAYDIFDIDLKGDSAFIKGYKDIDGAKLKFTLPNTLVNYKTNRGDTNQETKDMLDLVTIGTLVKNNDKINPPFTYKVYGIKTELELIPSSPQDAIKLINIIKETIKNKYKFEMNKLFISDVIIEKQAFSKGNF